MKTSFALFCNKRPYFILASLLLIVFLIVPAINANAADNAKMKRGPILDVWLLDGKDLTAVPSEPSMGVMVDNSKLFSFGAFRKDSYLKTYYKNKPTGLMWSGYLNIEEAGTYLLVHELDMKPVKNGGNFRYNMYSKLLIDGDVVLENESPTNISANGGLFPKTTTLKLTPGIYKFQLWLAVKWTASTYGVLEPGNINVKVLLRSPSARRPVAITGESLFHDEL